ncbi:hypothetical protein BDA99DRAFT_543590 [Phascolomyces articulosus]|uniref:Uncharacterized protein n=1 Tax=Phascolomyces articulosus TaxID=60185 RepID=A0AAD5JYK9_9FUNG|nr:hypothetical protein BDA99DRAFT_543590 [Phascolomyces articulosus]
MQAISNTIKIIKYCYNIYPVLARKILTMIIKANTEDLTLFNSRKSKNLTGELVNTNPKKAFDHQDKQHQIWQQRKSRKNGNYVYNIESPKKLYSIGFSPRKYKQQQQQQQQQQRQPGTLPSNDLNLHLVSDLQKLFIMLNRNSNDKEFTQFFGKNVNSLDHGFETCLLMDPSFLAITFSCRLNVSFRYIIV